MLTQEVLMQHLEYNLETGVFTWKEPRARRCKIGDVAGTPHKRGYIHIKLFGKSYKAHRLAFLYMTGEWPECVVDHIDGNTSNNKWCNLRDISNSDNQYNRKGAAQSSSTGLLGASILPSGKYRAQIKYKGKVFYLGEYTTPEQAHAAYLAARKDFNVLVF